MVGVAQLVRALDCGSSGRGFKSPRPPQFLRLSKAGSTAIITSFFGPLAQLAEHLTLNQGVTGSIPVRSTRR